MKRAWIIGNGPSLKPEHLAMLRDETSFACGRINRMYDKTTWRPNFYVYAETPGKKDESELRKDLVDIGTKHTTAYIQLGLKDGLFNNAAQAQYKNHVFFRTCQHQIEPPPPETWHLPQICGYGSSLHVAMQFATLIGYSPLYLIGCDVVGGHFDEYRLGGDRMVETEMLVRAHEIAWNSHILVYNATDGGELEVYPRVSIEDVLC